MRQLPFARSIRFRLTVLYSTLLFALAGTALAITYIAVAQSTDPRPITRQEAALLKDKGYGRFVRVGTIDVAAIDEIESAVNYNTLQKMRDYSLIALGGLFVASLGIGWVLSGRALRPVGAIARTARQIQATDLSRRIHLEGPRDELRDLADTIDSMLDRLDHAFQAQRQLIDDASHELRSPLAIIRTNLDASLTDRTATGPERERAIAVIDRATARMSRLIEDLLATARRDADSLADTDIELDVLAREAGEEFAPQPFRYDLTTGLHIIGDHDALRRAIGNLLSNAVRLAPAGSTITIATGRADSWLWLAVADEGPGIAADDLPKVFDRFWRGVPTVRAAQTHGTAQTKGAAQPRERRTGLGLAIVRQIVESHGGHVAAFSVVGVGSTFVLWLPTINRAGGAPPPAENPWRHP